MTKLIWCLFAVAMIFYALGDYFAKLLGNTGKWQYCTWAMIGYSVTSICFLIAMSKWSKLTILGSLWNVTYSILTLIIAFAFFGEKVGPSQLVGLGLGIVSVFLLTR